MLIAALNWRYCKFAVRCIGLTPDVLRVQQKKDYGKQSSFRGRSSYGIAGAVGAASEGKDCCPGVDIAAMSPSGVLD